MVAKVQRVWLGTVSTLVVPKASGDVGVWVHRVTGSSKGGLSSVTDGVPEAKQWAHWIDSGKASLGRMLLCLPGAKQEHGCDTVAKCIHDQPEHTCFFSKTSLSLTVQS